MSIAKLRDARAALARSDYGAARDALVAAWRSRRSPTLAELVATLDALAPDALTQQLAAILTPRVVSTHANLKQLAKVDDPRLATWTLDALANPPFCAVTAEKFLVDLAATIARLADPRLDAALPNLGKILTARLTRKPVYTKVIGRLVKAVEARPKLRTASKAELALEAELVAACTPLRKSTATIESLYAEVYANPNDDAPRVVLADALLERNDPRGEFITLQLARGREGEPSQRELELLKKHGKQWLGPLASVLSFGKGYSSTAFTRGFVSTADFIFKIEKKLPLIAADPAWATVEDIDGLGEHLITRAPLRALRVLVIDEDRLVYLERRTEPFPSVTEVALHTDLRTLPRELVKRLCPAIAKLELGFVPDDLAAVAALGVRELVIDLYRNSVLEQDTHLHHRFLKALATTRATIDRVCVRAPWSSYPGPEPVVYTRGPSGTYVVTPSPSAPLSVSARQ
ncbi:MAG: TIGR02996 domain-containing protein [Myxococcota bacterium]|nr:TIGR02996 domain-containing protein [Myxococcota bacterium]